jgi:hypothetical protein
MINKHGHYSRKVRLLGGFHPGMARLKEPDAQDIDDPLYGNVGGQAEKACGARRLFRFVCQKAP